MPRAACVVTWGLHQSGGGGLRSESTCGSGVGGGCIAFARGPPPLLQANTVTLESCCRKSHRNATPTVCNPHCYNADTDSNQVDDDDDAAEGNSSGDVEGNGGGDVEGSGDGDTEDSGGCGGRQVVTQRR
ncbi:hypothetical protein EDB84DRAFT_1443772 [Lactarius hengduanensis]|nr:hypothetical protein EDB84DRAFT_1443772 [Lactarius hengduanensis]